MSHANTGEPGAVPGPGTESGAGPAPVTSVPLPCYPCPYDSACCAWGTTLTDEEAAAVIAAHGPDVAYQTKWGEWRTRVRQGRCALYQDNRCIIHGEPYYPAVCRCFPWYDAETGGAYEFDRTICPEFKARPELVRIGRE
ncbi:MAG TPA: hypothetical protein VK012_05175 [Gemmatimonadales bacterium]|nr:hypothetical protein [Gemmatimonadales bacterium]